LLADGEASAPLDVDALVAHVHADHMRHAVIIDCAASDEIGRRYGEWLERGIHVITPNKRANTASLGYYRALREANRAQGAHLPVRDDRRRRAADHPDVARPRAHRR
jgi:aspartokinase/homoserine dehydrogenase 1